jgi:hypothetical protein
MSEESERSRMTVAEAFILLQKSHFDDCANSVCGLLRDLASRTDPDLKDEVQGSIKEFLLSCAQRLRDNNERSTREITEHFGEDRRKELTRQFWEDGVSAHQIWLDREK